MATAKIKKDYFNLATELIDNGRLGLNKGISLGSFKSKLDNEIYGIQKGTYYLIGARLKVGKTAFVDDTFVFNAYESYMRNKGTENEFELDIDYWSFEISVARKIIKAVTRQIYLDKNLLLNPAYILSKGKHRVSQEHYDIVINYRKFFEELEQILHLRDSGENPTGINKYLYRKAADNGKILYNEVEYKDETGVKRVSKEFSNYIPNNQKRYHFAIFDHAGLTPTERNFTTKQNIDKLSEYIVSNRNKYNLTCVLIQQFNSWSDEADNAKYRGSAVPTLESFSGSKYTPRDADVIMALHDPYSYEDMEYRGFPVNKFKNTIRNLEILRNRDGEPNRHLAFVFNGMPGIFYELPSPSYFASQKVQSSSLAKEWIEYSQNLQMAIEKAQQNGYY